MAVVNGGGIFHYTDVKKFLKNLLQNSWSDFEIISQKCSLTAPFSNIVTEILIVISEWGLLSLYRHEQILKKSSLQPLVRFWNNFIEMFLG